MDSGYFIARTSHSACDKIWNKLAYWSRESRAQSRLLSGLGHINSQEGQSVIGFFHKECLCERKELGARSHASEDNKFPKPYNGPPLFLLLRLIILRSYPITKETVSWCSIMCPLIYIVTPWFWVRKLSTLYSFYFQSKKYVGTRI